MRKPHRARLLPFTLLLCLSSTGWSQQPAESEKSPTAAAAPVTDTATAPSSMTLSQLNATAEAGNDDAQFELGTRYLYGTGVEQDNFSASRWFRLAAEQGNNNAQYNLGVMALNGIGAITDFNEALRWFELAAGNGDTAAQFTLGVIHANGRGVPQDFMLAHMWFTVAAAGGDKNASVNAVLFQEMLTVEQYEESQRRSLDMIERFNAAR